MYCNRGGGATKQHLLLNKSDLYYIGISISLTNGFNARQGQVKKLWWPLTSLMITCGHNSRDVSHRIETSNRMGFDDIDL